MVRRRALSGLLLCVILLAGACTSDSASEAASSADTTAGSSTTTSVPTSDAGPTTLAPGRSPTTGKTVNAGGPPATLAAIPFPAPRPGAYRYHERVQPQSGSPAERTIRYQLSPVKGRAGVIRLNEVDLASGAARENGEHYDLAHDREGMFLLTSLVAGKAECRWAPRSVMLPRPVLTGGTSESVSSCTVPVNGKQTTFRLETKLRFLRTHDLQVAGGLRRVIDVERHRVVSGDAGGPFTITSRAVDTYAFDLGVRVRTEDRSRTESNGKVTESVRTLTLTGTP